MQQTDQINQGQSLLLVANHRLTADMLDAFLNDIGKLNNPDTLVIDTQNQAGIDEIRNLKEFLKTQPIYQTHKIAIIQAADELNHVSQNALLKILEEPPVASKIILTTTNPAKLLATVQSRLKLIFLDSEEITKVDSQLLTELEQLKSQSLGQRMLSLEKRATKEKLIPYLNQLIVYFRDATKQNQDKGSLFNLTVCLYCLQLAQANVNTKGVTDYLALKLKF